MPRFIFMPMEELRITTVQSSLHWEDVVSNLKMFNGQLTGLAGMTDLVVLPEMFTTGFSMNARVLAEEMNGRTIDWMAGQAQRLDAVVTGSIIISENGIFFNRCIWMRPDGNLEYYDKHHLFTMANEHKEYQAGQEKLITELHGWKICPLICYDLRFPVWGRNKEGYDLLIYMANWPEKRSHHWRQLLIARAIENQAYVVGVNRVGTDGNGFNYQGDTSVIDYSGKLLYQTANVEDVFTCKFQKTKLTTYRDKLNFLPDQDKFKIL